MSMIYLDSSDNRRFLTLLPTRFCRPGIPTGWHTAGYRGAKTSNEMPSSTPAHRLPAGQRTRCGRRPVVAV